ncbi:hypothetical protein LCGC14_0958230 [marine sediment metagenome]|uniref:Uncharacterized protein n=1 Tax=marine sediment metagenome TaxID=412755 RepID=A0A0F9P1A7_9ZZZZ
MSKKNKLGDCFENSVELMMENRGVDFILVHGLVTGTGGDVIGMRYVHAWVELGNIVIDTSREMNTPVIKAKNNYYEIGKIKASETKRYNLKEVADMVLKYKVYGPWEIKATKEELAYEKTLT